MPQVTGVILGRPESTTGEGKNGRRWVQHKFSVLTSDGHKRSMTTFDAKAFGELKEGQTYLLTYTEKPNPRSAQYPFLNLESWTPSEPIAPKPIQKDDFLRSKEQCTLENMLIATAGVWDTALILYDMVTKWEKARKAGIDPVEVQTPAVYEPMIDGPVKSPEPVAEPVQTQPMETYEALKILNEARFQDGQELLTVAKLAALSKKTYQKNLRELTSEQIQELTIMVTNSLLENK
jgi:hypothetical protein